MTTSFRSATPESDVKLRLPPLQTFVSGVDLQVIECREALAPRCGGSPLPRGVDLAHAVFVLVQVQVWELLARLFVEHVIDTFCWRGRIVGRDPSR